MRAMVAARTGEARERQVTFIDELSERLLLGQVLTHPDRFPEVMLTDEHFNGRRRTIFRILQQRAARDLSLDAGAVFNDLWTARALTLAADCILEWGECPVGLRELERNLRASWCHRRMRVGGEFLLAAAQATAVPLETSEAVAALVDRLQMLGDAFAAIDADQCRPLFAENEVRAIARSTTRHYPGGTLLTPYQPFHAGDSPMDALVARALGVPS